MKNLSNKEANKVTRECLQTALIQLMSQKPFEKITITELVRRSGVSRTAFYRNYESKDEILNEVCRSFIDSMSASFSDPTFQKDPVLWYRCFFQDIWDHAMLFGLLLEAHMLNTSAFTSSYSLVKKDHDGEPASLYRYLAWEGAFSTIVVRWFQGGRKESIDFMAEFCSQVLVF